MELGLAGRRAIICAASRGLGFACADALAREGVAVTIAARRVELLEDAAGRLRDAYGVPVIAVAADVAPGTGREAIMGACPDPDILVNNCGGAPPGDFRDWSREDWIRAVDGNMLSAIFLIRATLDAMIARRFGRSVNSRRAHQNSERDPGLVVVLPILRVDRFAIHHRPAHP